MLTLKDQIVLVTGAGSGIGKALACAFARCGAEVILVGRTESRLQETRNTILAEGGKAVCEALDITDNSSVAQLFQRIRTRWGKIDLIYNNAGSFNSLGGIWEVDPEEWWWDATVNLRGPMLMMHYGIQLMLEHNSGTIINMNGGGATVPLPGGSGYGSSKAALLRLTETVAEELKREGKQIIVVSMGPGLVRTEMTEKQAHSEIGKKWIPSTQEAFLGDRDLSPAGCVKSVLELLTHLDPVFNGRIFSKGADFAKIKKELLNNPDSNTYKLRLN